MTKSKKIPAGDRTRAGVHQEAEMVPTGESPDGWTLYRAGPGGDEYLFIIQEMDGALAGFEAEIRVDLVDGELVLQRPITFTPKAPMPFATVSTATWRELRFGEIHAIVEERLSQWENVDQTVLPYLAAARAHKRRPGRKGTPDILWADIARKRIDAERESPRGAIRYMVRTWPDEFASVKAADSKVSRARRKGMLEGRGSNLRLTEKATRLLEGKSS